MKKKSDSEEKENKVVFFSSRLVYPRKRGIQKRSALISYSRENFLFFIMEKRIPTALSWKYRTIL